MTVASTIISYSSPGLVVSIIAGVFFGLSAVALYDKAIRNNLFLPYFYFANGALMYTLAEAFQVVWSTHYSPSSKFTLDATLLSMTLGTCFVLLALYRLLELWYMFGLREAKPNTKPQSTYSRRTLVISLTVILGTVISLVADILFSKEDEVGSDDINENVFKAGVILKSLGAVLDVVLVIIYVVLVCLLAASQACRSDRKVPFNKYLVVALLLLGVMALLRSLYFAYLVIISGNLLSSDEEFDTMKKSTAWPYLTALIIVPSMVLFLTAFLCDLTKVKPEIEPVTRQAYSGVVIRRESV